MIIKKLKRGSRHPAAKLKPVQVRRIRRLLARGRVSKAQIARDYSVSPLVITRIELGVSYRDVV